MEIQEKIDYLVNIANEFELCFENDTVLFDKLNNLSQNQIDKLLNMYQIENDVKKIQPINLLRLWVIKKLNNHELVTVDDVLKFENNFLTKNIDYFSDFPEHIIDLIKNFDLKKRGPFVVWKKNFRKLYTLLLNPNIDIVNDYLNSIIDQLKHDTNLQDFNFHVVNFNGTQNFGETFCWFALYPNTIKKHSDSYQLFCMISSQGLKFGIYTGSKIKNFENLDENHIGDLELINNYEKLKDQFTKNKTEVLKLNAQILTQKDGNYYLLVSNPKIWSFESLKIGETDEYTALNEEGNKRNVYEHFQNLQIGDKIVGYVASPVKKMINVCEVKDITKNDDIVEKFEFQKIEDLDYHISLDEIRNDDILSNSEPNKRGFQGSLFKLTEEEYNRIINFMEPPTMNTTPPKMNTVTPKNQILYGPPGTGKTYNVINHALAVIENKSIEEISQLERNEINRRFNEYMDKSQIEFVTFHQSYSYEEFIEGLKAETDDNANIHYEVKDGVFKKIANIAKSNRVKSDFEDIKIADYQVFIMFLNPESFQKTEHYNNCYDYCLENNVIALGWGQDLDFKNLNNLDDIMKLYNSKFQDKTDFGAKEVNIFKNVMKVNDIVLISDKLSEIKAIGRVTSEYEYRQSEINIYQFREVEWLVKNENISAKEIIKKQIIPQTLYKPKSININFENLNSYLNPKETNVSKNYAIIIDEINRGNISKIFGELITLIEDDKRIGGKNELKVTLPYSQESFGVPSNLYIIGTMNTADRSIALIDTALRRRFTFTELMPDSSKLDGILVKGIDIKRMFEKMNERIEFLFDRDHTLGHAFFMELLNGGTEEEKYQKLQNIFKNKIIPLLQEYFYDDWEKIQLVLGDHKKQLKNSGLKGFKDDDKLRFIQSDFTDLKSLFTNEDIELDDKTKFRINPILKNENKLMDPNAFIKIYNSEVIKPAKGEHESKE